MSAPVEPTYTRQQVAAALNWAADAINEAAGLDDEGTIDALNLLVNAVGAKLDDPDVTLASVAVDAYSIETEDGTTALGTILAWINS